MDDEAGEQGGAVVGETAVPEEQGFHVAELLYGEVSGQGGLHSLLAYDAHAYVCCLDHAYVVAAIAYSEYCLFGLFVAFYAFSQQFLLTGGAATADHCRHQHGSLEEVIRDVLIFQHEGECFSIDDEYLIEVVLHSAPIGLPQFWRTGFLDFDVGLSGFLQSTGATDALCGLHFVACYHPHFDAACTQTLYGGLETVLEFVFDACDAEEVHAKLQFEHESVDGFLIDF